MSLFVCTRCNGVDNTAIAPGYVLALGLEARWPRVPPPYLCTWCSTGEWHGQFPQRDYDPQADGPLGLGRQIMPREMPEAPCP